MSTIRLHRSDVTANDRIGVTIFLALALHAVIILGISFDYENLRNDENEALPTLEVTLAHSALDQKPDEADYLAQADQQGSGNTEEKTRPQSPPDAIPDHMPNPGDGQTTSVAAIQHQPTKPLTTELLTQDQASFQVIAGEETPPEDAKIPAAAELIRRSMEMAKLEAELNEIVKVYSNQPKEKLLVPNTMSHVEAAYLDAWQKKVELIGNMNYPAKAKENNLSGDLLLMVAVNQDGSLNRVELWRSSGHKILDDAAIAIVKQASPFPPLPQAIKEQSEVLKIPRTWKFMLNNTLSTL